MEIETDNPNNRGMVVARFKSIRALRSKRVAVNIDASASGWYTSHVHSMLPFFSCSLGGYSPLTCALFSHTTCPNKFIIQISLITYIYIIYLLGFVLCN